MASKKRRKYQKRHAHDFFDFQEEIEALFNKKFVLKSNEEAWELPHSSTMFQEPPFILADLISLKDDLNQKKSLLNDMDIVKWHLHTRRTHKAGLVVKHLRENFNAEMCTQAWTKFYEILNTFDLIPEDAQRSEKVRSVHLCEAPGAFVASLNHYLKSHYNGMDWQWVANTLNPYYEGNDLEAMLDDDRFILKTLSHWNFGVDGTGDLMNLANLDSLKQETGESHLVTADGSINCANQPDEQESLVGQLIFCEAVAAMNLLCQGGNFVFKMFTALEHQMVSLMYLLACVFQEIQVITPGTSKSGNSEVYIVCLRFIGEQQIPSCILEELRKAFTPHCPLPSLFSLQSIPGTFLERLRTCQKYFTGLQMEAIDLNIQQFHYMTSAERKAHNQLRQLVVENYVEKFHLQPISEEEHIVMSTSLDGTQLSFNRGPTNCVPFAETFAGTRQRGSYNQRQGNLHQNWLDKIKVDSQLKFCPSHSRTLQDLSQVSSSVPLIPLSHDQVVWLPRTKSSTPESWKPKTAACFFAILNSRFCTPIYVSKLQEAHQQAAILREENADNLRGLLDKVNPSNIVKMSSGGEAELRNLDNLVFFSEMAKGENYGVVLNLVSGPYSLEQYLQEKSARFNSIWLHMSTESGTPHGAINNETLCNSQRVNLVFANFSHTNELSSKREIVYLCIVALRLLESGGMFVLNFHQTLTRFSVGILFIMHQVFDKLAIVKPVVSHLFSPQRFLVCKGFLNDVEHYITYLAQVFDQLSKLNQEKSAFDVVEIVPMDLLYSEQFYSFVKRTNEQLAYLQLKEIVQLENFFLNPDQLPLSEEISNLKKEVTSYLK